MKISTLLLLLLCIPLCLSAQFTYTVVAASGLKLRATPSQQGKVLAVAPFGAQVTVQNMQKKAHSNVVPNARRDTIGTLRSVFVWNEDHVETQDQPHTGFWWPVRYQGKTGYMFSGFLVESVEPASIGKELNAEWRFMAPGGTICSSARPDMKHAFDWYGLYRQPDGKFALRAVRLVYKVADYTQEDGSYDLVDRELIILTDTEEQPLYIIGHKGKLAERTDISGAEAYSLPLKPSAFLATEEGRYFPDPVRMRSYGVLVEPSPDKYTHTLSLLREHDAPQQLFLKPSETYGGMSPSELLWTGDLDGDGRRDYLFDAAGEIGGLMLYLSSQAGKGEVAGLAAVMWHWYCC